MNTSIKETKEVFEFAVAVINAGGKSYEDGKIDWTDTLNLSEPLRKGAAAFEGLASVPLELVDLDDAEKSVLFELAEKVELKDDAIEEKAEKLLQTVVLLAQAVSLWMPKDDIVQMPVSEEEI